MLEFPLSNPRKAAFFGLQMQRWGPSRGLASIFQLIQNLDRTAWNA